MPANVQIHGDYAAIDAHFDLLSNAPTPKGVAALEAVLNAGLGSVQAATHIDTGSLKSSEKAESERVPPHSWEGTITAGGPSAGVNNPVDYAIYEKRRGGAHDFFEPLDGLRPLWIKAVQEGMK